MLFETNEAQLAMKHSVHAKEIAVLGEKGVLTNELDQALTSTTFGRQHCARVKGKVMQGKYAVQTK